MSRSQGNREQSEFVGTGVPRDPATAGFVGKKRMHYAETPDPEGNRAARRAYAKGQRRQARKTG